MRCFASRRSTARRLRTQLQVFTLHAELEGMRLLRRLRVAARASGATRAPRSRAWPTIHELALQTAAARPRRGHGRDSRALGIARRPGVRRRQLERSRARRLDRDRLDVLRRSPLFVALVWFATLALRPLFNPDEGRYAEIPREMLSGGDWVIPHLNGLRLYRKAAAAVLGHGLESLDLRAERVRGALVYGARARSAPSLPRRSRRGACGARAAAMRAAALLSGMLMFVVLGQLLTLDMSLTPT